MSTDPHSFLNDVFYVKHASLLCRSYERFTGKPLLTFTVDPNECITKLFDAPFALVSHGTEEDPIFNFGNQTALDLFELTWPQFTVLASRMSAEPLNREKRQMLLDRVARHGYIDNYKGIRISSTGRKFLIENATVWNIVDDLDRYHGQAAAFNKWSYL